MSRSLLRRPGLAGPLERAEPVRIGDARLARVLPADAVPRVLLAGMVHLEGPAWQASHDRLVFSDVPNRRLMAWYPDGRVEVLVEGAWFVNGNAVAADGAIWHCEHGRRCVSRSAPDPASLPEPVATRFGGARLNAPNDIAVAPDGALWFTDPVFGIVMPSQGALADPELDHRSVYRLDPASGVVSRMADLAQPNGIGFAPDGRTLYVSDTSVSLAEVPGMAAGDERSIYAFGVEADGTLSPPRRFWTPPLGYPDGFAVDGRGWLWSSAADGVHVLDAEGCVLGTLPLPATVSNLCFGGADGRRLFVAAGERLFALDLAG